MKHIAVFSPDRRYRYTLYRAWQTGLLEPRPGYVQFIGLNPSTADEFVNDPTLRRCIRFACSWGYSSLYMTNLFAYRATDPRDMKAQSDPVGFENDKWLSKIAHGASIIVAAWGIHGKYLSRDRQVIELLRSFQLRCLGKVEDGAPKHPLYLSASAKLIPV